MGDPLPVVGKKYKGSHQHLREKTNERHLVPGLPPAWEILIKRKKKRKNNLQYISYKARNGLIFEVTNLVILFYLRLKLDSVSKVLLNFYTENTM